MADTPDMTGRILAARYRLEQRLGVGGMGSIWRAEHLTLRAPVAVKLIDPEIADDEESKARFFREAQAAAALRSPHVVQILDYGVDDHLPFIVMELLEGESLADRLRRLGRLSPQETARVITHVARAVGRAHEASIVHRDLKPENVFLVHNEDDEVAKVLDFGVAKVDDVALGPKGSRTRTGSLLGTPYYMSPEQAQGNKATDHRSDLWSLGVIAFECLTGTRPFYSEGLGDLVLQICVRDVPVPSTLAPVPPSFDAWFARAVAREPDQRFQSARELAETLREALGVGSLGDGRETPGRSSSVQPGLPAPSLPTAPTPRADAIAATVAASPTLRQFGTTTPRSGRHAAPPPASGRGLVAVVALGALAVGATAGFALLGDVMMVASPPRGALDGAQKAAAASRPRVASVAEPAASAAPPPSAPAATGDVPDVGIPDAAGAPEEAAPSQPAPTAKVVAESPRAAAEDAGAPSVAPGRDAAAPPADAWVKPEWARPEGEAEPPTEAGLP